MTSYASVQDVIATISKKIAVQLTDDDEKGQVDEAPIELAIQRAQGLVDSALSAAGYAIPVAQPIPDGAGVLNAATTWLAICDLASRRGILPEDYKTQCDLYQSVLDRIRQGLLALPIPAGTTNLPHSSTDGQQRRLSLTKYDKKYTGIRNPDEDHTLDVV
jgi:phage gp36-like protein